MKFILLIFIFISCSKEQAKLNNNNLLTIDFEIENYTRLSLKERKAKKEKWKQRIEIYKKRLEEDIKSRNLTHNLNSLKFEVLKHIDQGAKCDYEKQTIKLGIDFTESNFIHEIGHCLNTLNYSHYFSYDKDNTEYIMSYAFNDKYLKSNRKRIMDIFFNTKSHHKLDSKLGHISHKRMILERDFHIKTKELSFNEINKLYYNKIGLE